MEPIQVFEVEVAGQKTVATLEMLSDVETTVNGEKTALDTPEKVEALFGEGSWKTIRLKAVWTGEDETAVERALTSLNQDTQRFERDGLRYLGVLVSKAVTEWDFPQEVSEAGFNQLPATTRSIVGEAVRRRCYPTLLDHKVFTQRSTAP